MTQMELQASQDQSIPSYEQTSTKGKCCYVINRFELEDA